MNKCRKIGLVSIALLSFTLINSVKADDSSAAGKANGYFNYRLPQPGILPDDKLYKLTVLRDNLMFYFIRNPLKKFEYYIMLSDRGISSTTVLIDKGEIELAKQTAFKAEHYFTRLISDYKWYYWFGNKLPSEMRDKIILSANKHQEILNTIIDKVDEKDKNVFKQALSFSKRNLQTFMEVK